MSKSFRDLVQRRKNLQKRQQQLEEDWTILAEESAQAFKEANRKLYERYPDWNSWVNISEYGEICITQLVYNEGIKTPVIMDINKAEWIIKQLTRAVESLKVDEA